MATVRINGKIKEVAAEKSEGDARGARGIKMGMSKSMRMLFPFTAMVGQEKMKRALILNAINPRIGGVLIRGQKGTAKSTAVRGLAEILPSINSAVGCRFNCNPKDIENLCFECQDMRRTGMLRNEMRQMLVVDLPIGATEDRVVGSLDLEKVVTEGTRGFEVGILAEANRGILYVDEINLLDDYVVDALLDAAAMGMNTVEREGVSLSHPAKFIIVGSMNPEEGELRPQLLDRIALQVEVQGITDLEQRVEIIRRNNEFQQDPVSLRRRFESDQERLKSKIEQAQMLISKVETKEEDLRTIANICIAFSVDGHRADIMIERTARTNAAFEGRDSIIIEDILEAAEMVLPHRMRKRPFEEGEFNVEQLRRVVMQDRQ